MSNSEGYSNVVREDYIASTLRTPKLRDNFLTSTLRLTKVRKDDIASTRGLNHLRRMSNLKGFNNKIHKENSHQPRDLGTMVN